MFSRDNNHFSEFSTSNFVNYFYKKFSDELREEYTASSEINASLNTEQLRYGPYKKHDGLQNKGFCGKQENFQTDKIYKCHLSNFLESFDNTSQDTSKSFLWLNHIQKFTPVLSKENCCGKKPISNGLISWYNKESEFKKDILNHRTSQLGSEIMFVHGILIWLYSQKIPPKLNHSFDRIQI